MTKPQVTRTTEDAQERLDDDGAPPRPLPRPSRLRGILSRIDPFAPPRTIRLTWLDLLRAAP